MAKKPYSREGYLEENYHYFHLRDTAGAERDFHFHEFDKIVLLLSGRVDYAVEDQLYALRPWDLLLVKHHAIHKAVIDRSEPYERIIIYLDRKYFDRAMPGARLFDCFDRADRDARYLLTPDEEQRTALAALLGSVEESLRSEAFGAQAMCDTYMMQLLILLGRLSFSEADSRDADGQYDEKIAAVLSYVNENLSGDGRASVSQPLSLHAPVQGSDRQHRARLCAAKASHARGKADTRRHERRTRGGGVRLFGLFRLPPRLFRHLRHEPRQAEALIEGEAVAQCGAAFLLPWAQGGRARRRAASAQHPLPKAVAAAKVR